MKKIRVYELARELNMESRVLVDKIKSIGVVVSSYQSVLSHDQIAKIRKSFGEPPKNEPVKKRVMIKRRKKAPEPVETDDSGDLDHQSPQSSEAEMAHGGDEASDNELNSTELGGTQEPTLTQMSHDDAAVASKLDNNDQPLAEQSVGTTVDSSTTTIVAESRTSSLSGASSADKLQPKQIQQQIVDSEAAATKTVQPDDLSAQTTGETRSSSRFSKVAQALSQQREREGGGRKPASDRDGFSAAKIVSKAAENKAIMRPAVAQAGHSKVKKSEPSSPSVRFRDSSSAPKSYKKGEGRDGEGRDDNDDNVLKKSAIKKSKRPQFNPRDLLWSVDQEDSFVRHTRKKTVYSPSATKNRDHRRRKDLKKTQLTTPKASIRVVEMAESTLSVGELAHQLSMKAAELITHLMKEGIMATLNERLDMDTVTLVAAHFDYEVKTIFKTAEEILARSQPDPQYSVPRPPIVTFMGHVDHGKTSLLDAIRHGSTCESEDGGITQHIGAYMVDHGGKKVTFLDTPGHAAFSSIRGRGVKVTDIVVLVVAADDGVMPQTIEAISHAKNGEVPIIVAINKMDRPAKNLDRIYTQLAEHGIQAEEWGGEHQFVKLSALEKTGIDDLLEAIVLQAEILELTANTAIEPQGVIIEAHMDVGRGPVATIMVSEGIFRIGDEIVAGTSFGRIRAMKDDQGHHAKEAPPSTPVEIEGLNVLPMVGDLVDRVADRDQAKAVVSTRRQDQAQKARESTPISTLEELIAKVDSEKILSVPFIIKADTQGSMQAISEALLDIKSDKVKAKIVHQGVGAINASDIALAQASDAVIMGFNVRLIRSLSKTEDQMGVVIQYFSVIYELIDAAEALLAGSLPPIQNEVVVGRAEVRKLISVPKVGVVAGSAVSDGKIARHCKLRLIRDDVVIYDGKLGSLRRFKDDVKEVSVGFECGISFDSYKDLKEGDVIEAYEIEEIKATL